MVRTTTTSHALLLAFAIAGTTMALADDVPKLNVDPVCRGIAQQAASPAKGAARIWRFHNACRASRPSGNNS
jgi:hypothetical protein